jgi:hypothetical protein
VKPFQLRRIGAPGRSFSFHMGGFYTPFCRKI